MEGNLLYFFKIKINDNVDLNVLCFARVLSNEVQSVKLE